VKVRSSQYLNNLIEQEHRRVKQPIRPMLGFKRFDMSFRDLVIMMADRGITLTHTTILRWVQHYLPEFEKRSSR
jgi:transposase-like protein